MIRSVIAPLALLCLTSTVHGQAYTCADVKLYIAQHGWMQAARFAAQYLSAQEKRQALLCLRKKR